MVKISRPELYELVWMSPLSKVAPTFGVSATVLASICRTHKVPYPGSGYWTRKSLGQTVEIDALLPIEGTEQNIDIQPSKPRKRLPKNDPERPQTKISSQDISSSRDGRPIKQHPFIVRWFRNDQRAYREAVASRYPWRLKNAPRPTSDVYRRRHAILDKLFHDLERRGGELSETDGGICVAIDGERIEFQVREKKRQVRLTPAGPNSFPSRDLVGTGRLVFSIKTYLRGAHNEEWLETDRNPLENQIPQIIDRLFSGARILKEWHAELLAADELRKRRRAEREERHRLAVEEQRRRVALREIAADWRAANEIRNLIAAIKAKSFDGNKVLHGKSLSEWFAWAEAAAANLDISSEGPEGLFSVLGMTIVPAGSA